MLAYDKTLIVKERPSARVPVNVAECWLENAHVRRVLRASGVDEIYLTGNGADFEKLAVLLEALSSLHGSPACDAIVAELRALGCTLTPNAENAAAIWQQTAAVLGEKSQRPEDYLAEAGVGTLLVATSPLDFEEKTFYPANGAGKCQILPLFSPDELFASDSRQFALNVQKLGERTGVNVQEFEDFCTALEASLEVFLAAGCPGGLHSTLVQYGFRRPDPYHAGEIFRRALTEKHPEIMPQERALLFSQLMRVLGKAYQRMGMTMHLIPSAGVVGEQLAELQKTPENHTVCGLNAENGLVALLDYLKEYRCLPQLVIALSAAVPYNLLHRLSGRFEPLDGKPRILWGIDGEWCTAADAAAIARAICRESAAGTFVGVLRDTEGFLTAPVTRILSSMRP
ncbi:MAG: hypothetical protein E7644_07730 [Ruminococcaceae bacterium]|nr:hypothetical protein [Oscillospiraceae bacterium]